MIIPIVEGHTLNSGVKIVAGAIPFNLLGPLISTPWRNATTKEGYQRKPTRSRINKLVGELKAGKVDVPTAILINASHDSWKHSISNEHNGCLKFDLSKYQGKLSIVDGQHRVQALKILHEDSPDRYGDYKLQFVMMLGATENQELEQFYIVNSTAKSVKTDLALDLLKQRADQSGSIMNDLIASGQDWKVRAQGLVEELHSHSDIWRGKIRLANEDKGRTVLPSSSMVSSFKSFLKTPFAESMNFQQQYNLIDVYWQGIRGAIRQPFDSVPDYTLQKGIGVWAMHEILPIVMEIVRSNGDPLMESDSYVPVLETMFETLEGENKNAENVRGHEFWLTAPKGGAAGMFSSSAGKRVLKSKLINCLPRIEIE